MRRDQQKAMFAKNKPNLKITELMSLDKKNELREKKVEGFSSRTTRFESLGYPDKKSFKVKLSDGNRYDVFVGNPDARDTKYLNRFKGIKFGDLE